MKTTWFDPCRATLLSTDQSEFRSRAGNFFSRLKVKSTSFALKGWPSDHLTPLRMVNVRVLSLLDHAHAVDSHGVVAPFFSEST